MYQYKKDTILFTCHPDPKLEIGWYEDDTGLIYISSKLSEVDREIVYFHERQHKKCHQGRCHCWNRKTDFWSEYHAMKAEFEDCVKLGPKFLRRYKLLFKRSFETYRSDKKLWDSHYRAAMKLMRLKAFNV